VKEKYDADRGLKKIRQRVASFDVHEFMGNHGAALGRGGPFCHVGRQKNRRVKQAVHKRATNFRRKE
jgi:hypothetical protein